MAAITPTLAKRSEFSGKSKLFVLTATLTSASDTITLTEATHKLRTIEGIVGAVITSGMDTTFTTIQVSFSGLVITVVSKGQDGAAATTFGNVSITICGQ